MEKAGKELRRMYHRKVLEVLMRATKVALEALRKRLAWVEKGTCKYSERRVTDDSISICSVDFLRSRW